MTQEAVLTRFLGLENEDETVVEAWKLFIETQRAYRDVDLRRLSRREGDNVRRGLIRYMKQHGLKAWDEEDGLPKHELAIAREGAQKADLTPVDSLDIGLLVGFEALCAAWVADDPRTTEDFPQGILAFFYNPLVDLDLKERLIEKEKERGERLLKAVLEARPAAVSVHAMLVKHYERAGRLAEAEAEYQRMLAASDDELVWANYGEFLERRGRYEEAFKAYKTSFEGCERIGKAGEGLGAMVTENISRVERMKNLEGEEAQKARAFWAAVWLIEDVRAYAERAFEAELEKAQAEYQAENGLEKIGIEEAFEFLNWFLFTRALEDGRTPGLVYAAEQGLSDELKAKLQGLGRPITGAFEVVSVEPATFTIMVKDKKTGAEYELRADAPELKAEVTFEAALHPWGEFYLTGGIVRPQEEGASGE
jgi:tetratricopeptide (TPR) repeat protein